ncbi:MAG: flagellar M-ring protein FliF [Thermovirga sp.]|jgi:flagellar M-ring protein FliF|nr:flagellar M-ring protein FliF [Thermovirga sp.]MDN5368384.1 flagellar M-ring protein FliF [Thermovirga sp.]
MESIKALFSKFNALWSSWSKRQKVVVAATVAGTLLVLVGLVIFSGRARYAPLFSDLQMEDTAAIVSVLKEKNVPFRIDPSASAVLVPEDRVYELRLEMASLGLPNRGTVGFELFDNSKMGMTDFQQQVAYVRALEGELSRTISEIEVVRFAKVNLVLPKQRLFLKEQEEATASVLIGLRPGREISQDQVRAIMKLVASSVEGLSPENVSVVDTSGRLLSGFAEGGEFFLSTGSSVTSLQRELERRQEHDLERKVQNMLSAIYGPGNAVVRVRVELDFSRVSRSSKQFLPQGNGKGVVRSTQVTEENYSGTAAQSQGVGTSSNIPGYSVRTSGAGSGEYSKTDQVTNYEISTLQQNEERPPGTVKRITASVVINGSEQESPKEELYRSIASALGVDENRGDQLTVTFIPFASPDQFYAQVGDLERKEGFSLANPVVLIGGVAGLGAVALGLFMLLKRRRTKEEEAVKEAAKAEEVELLHHPKTELEILEEQISLYSESYPEEIASIIKKWLEES